MVLNRNPRSELKNRNIGWHLQAESLVCDPNHILK
jgi:hypothetical protein